MNAPGLPTPRRTPLATTLLLTALLATSAFGCDKGLQDQLDDKKEARYQAAEDELRAIETARTEALAEALPEEGAAEGEDAEKGRQHPMLQWRYGVAEREDEEKLSALRETYAGTPTEPAAKAGAAFAAASATYWGDFAEGEHNLSIYTGFLDGYLSDAETAREEAGDGEFVERPFLAEASFDKIFLHAARFFLVADRGPEVRLLSAYPYWQLAFGIPSQGDENFSEYVTRLCRSKDMKAHCDGVPHEVRPSAIHRPYVGWLKERIEAFVEENEVEIFDQVATRYLHALDEAEEEAPDLTEDPVLPETYSASAAPSGMIVRMSEKQGVRVLDTEVSDRFDGRVPGKLEGAIEKKIAELKDTPGNRIDFERVVLEAPGTLSGGELVDAVHSAPRDQVRQVVLVGRRRADDSLRRTGILVRLPAPDEGDTTSYAFKDQSDRTRCPYLGVAGKPPVGRKSPGSYLVIDKDAVRAAELSRDEETRELSVGDFTLETTPDDREALYKWADDNEGIVRMFVSADFTYDEIMKLVSGVLYKCKDITVTLDEREQDKVEVTCGQSVDRDITLVLGICR